MGESEARRSTAFWLLVALIFVSLAALVGLIVSQTCRAKPAHQRSVCVANLRALYHAIVAYSSSHGDVPHGKDGKVSIDRLTDPDVQSEVGIDPTVLRCPADTTPGRPSYLLNPSLKASDLRADSTTVVAFDIPTNHSGGANVLVGDGSVHFMVLPLDQRQRWVQLVVSGDSRAAQVCRGDAGDRWYVGGKEGWTPSDW